MTEPAPTWELLDPGIDEASWDGLALPAADASVFQSWRWGEYKRSAGWEPERWVARGDSGNPVALVQILVKRAFLGVRVGWAPGGPLFRLPGATPETLAASLGGLAVHLRRHEPRCYVRFDSYVPGEPALSWAMGATCARPSARINTGFTSVLDLRPSPDEILAAMTAKHRYYVRRALGEPIEWRSGNDPEVIGDLLSLNREMVERKALDDSIGLDKAEIARLCTSLGDRALLLVGRGGGEPLCACLVLRYGASAFYFAAATGERGRTIGASYALLFRLIEVLRHAGVARLDLGGLDPRSPAAGVNHFKGGFGGALVEYLGEWEWSSSSIATTAVNLAVRARRIGR